MKVLKDIAAAMDCHPKTAKRWWKKLRVPPDVPGNPHKWYERSFKQLIALWEQYYKLAGTTPQLVRAKYSGQLTDNLQLQFNFEPIRKKPQAKTIQAAPNKRPVLRRQG